MQQLAVLERKQDVYNELDDLLSRSGLLYPAACRIHSSLEDRHVLDGICRHAGGQKDCSDALGFRIHTWQHRGSAFSKSHS